jgi:hypothetical protein
MPAVLLEKCSQMLKPGECREGCFAARLRVHLKVRALGHRPAIAALRGEKADAEGEQKCEAPHLVHSLTFR